jgi:NAD(P)H-hydrate epimerase
MPSPLLCGLFLMLQYYHALAKYAILCLGKSYTKNPLEVIQLRHTIDEIWVKQTLPKRPKNAHKGAFGILTVLAGNRRYPGAAVLAVAGALRAGAGIVRLASIEPVLAAAAAQLPTCTLLPLPETQTGGVAAQALGDVLAAPATAVLAGCGMGNTFDTMGLIEGLLAKVNCPLVLDADALNVLAGHLEDGDDEAVRSVGLAALQVATQPVVLTPHIGEMSRLCGKSAADILAAPAETTAQFSATYGCVVVLKSHATVVAAPDGESYALETEGNPGLAKGGSGDVLAGIIAALAAQGIPPAQAAAAAVWLHAKAGALAAQSYGEAGMSPADLPLQLCEVWKQLDR